jgi:hypothetical protein
LHSGLVSRRNGAGTALPRSPTRWCGTRSTDDGGARRQLLHREIGRGLLAVGRLGEAAPHIGISAAPDDTQAIDVLCSAVRQAEERQAYREALEILGSLTDLLPAGDPRWRGVVDALSWATQWVVDHRADAHAGFDGVLAMRRMDAVLTPCRNPPSVAR